MTISKHRLAKQVHHQRLNSVLLGGDGWNVRIDTEVFIGLIPVPSGNELSNPAKTLVNEVNS